MKREYPLSQILKRNYEHRRVIRHRIFGICTKPRSLSRESSSTRVRCRQTIKCYREIRWHFARDSFFGVGYLLQGRMIFLAERFLIQFRTSMAFQTCSNYSVALRHTREVLSAERTPLRTETFLAPFFPSSLWRNSTNEGHETSASSGHFRNAVNHRTALPSSGVEFPQEFFTTHVYPTL